MIWIIREILALIAFSSAVVFGLGGLAGLFRFPDPYSRLQAGSLCGTTAVFSIFIGALLLASDTAVAARIVIIAIFFLMSAPTGSHIVARFTWNAGVYPWKPPKVRTGSARRRKKSRDSSEKRGGAE
ncbi:MAG: monovalent cation/H(+) antiporter subunit G [Spirochaetia bacterium]|nr:monovalent cation/H(+) antiporter subunit G [Spirochaetia bacterium]